MCAEDVGRRAMAANLSDLAAMGARPVLATVALGVPRDLPGGIAAIEKLYRGMDAVARCFGARIVGGDIVRSPVLSLAITVVGEVAASRLKLRSGGRARDVLAVTGPLGASRAGLALLEDGELATRAEAELAPELLARARAAFATPIPRVTEGRWLAASLNVHAMIDCSDGPASDVRRLAAASGLGARLGPLPVDPAAVAVAALAGADAQTWALSGGEDFALLVAVAPRAFGHLARRFAQRFGAPLTAIGSLETTAGVRRLAADGTPRPLETGGYDHLAADARERGREEG